MASDAEDFDDLEALRQAALASLKFRAKTEAPPQLEGPPSFKADEDEDLSVLREAALRSTKISSALVTQNKLAVDHKPRRTPQHRRHHYHRQRHSQISSRQTHPYNAAERKNKWQKCVSSKPRSNNLVVIPLSLQARNNKKAGHEQCKLQEQSGNDLELSSKKNVLLPQDKWARLESNVPEDISSSAVERNIKKRKDGKFSRYDDSESDEDSMSDSDDLSMSSESHLNKDAGSDSEESASQQLDTRIVKRDESKEILIQKTVTDNSELEATGDGLEIHDKISSDSLLVDYDEPLLDIQENGEIDDVTTAELNTSDKQVADESFCIDILPSESLDLEEEEAEPVVKQVFEARKKKFQSTEEIKGSDLKKTISLKGIVPKSRKRHHRHHRENKLSHSSHKEELRSRDLKERNCGEVEDLRLKTSRAKDYHRLRNSGSSKSSDDSGHSENFSDGISQPIRLKDHPTHQLGVSTSNRSNGPVLPYRENQRRVVQERSPKQNSTEHTRYHLSDLSDSGEDNENSLLKKRSLSSVVRLSPKPKRHRTRKVLDSDQHSNFQNEHYSIGSKERISTQPRGWAAIIKSRSKKLLPTKEDSDYHRAGCDNLDVEELSDDKSPRFNFAFEHDEVFPAKKLEDRLSAPRWIGFKSKQEKSPENQAENTGGKNKGFIKRKETELDQKILRIQEMNAAILKRQAEVKKDKERYG